MPLDPQILSFIDSDYPLVDPNLQPTPAAKVLEALENLLGQNVDPNFQGERVLQLLRLEKADNFYRGIQNIAPSMDPSTGSIFWLSFGSSGTPLGNTGATSDYDRIFDYNPRLVAAYGQKFVAVLGQRPFYNTTAEALDPTSDEDRKGARHVNLLLQMLHTQWKVRRLNHRLAYYLYKTGTTFGHLRPLTNGKKYGYYTIEIPGDPQDVIINPGGYDCPSCGSFTSGEHPDVHAQAGTQPFCQGCAQDLPGGMYSPPVTAQVPGPPKQLTIAHTSVDLELVNGYTITHPFNVVELEESPWLVSEIEKDIGRILVDHPNARDIVGPESYGSWGGLGSASSATAAVVRATAQSQSGTVRVRNTDVRTYRNIWLSASELEKIKDKQERELAKQMYRDGVRITQVEGKIVAVKVRDFRDEFSSCLPQMADYLFADGSSWGIFGLEDAISNLVNIAMETYETGITKFLVNQEYADADALNRNRYSPNRFMPTIGKAGGNLEEAFKIFPPSDPPVGLGDMAGMMKDFIEGFLGLLPAVYGEMPSGQTLGQARMMLNQGLLQLATVAEMMSGFWEQTDTNAVKMFLRESKVNPKQAGETIDLDAIRNSNWAIRGGSTMPRSYAERKDSLNEIITQNPDMAKAMHITDPVNFPALRELLEFPELKNPTADMVEALQDILGQLWDGQPQMVPQPDGSQQTTPSVQFDDLVFDPKVAVSVIQQALIEPYGMGQQNSPGYANVRAYLQMAQQAMQKSQAAQPQPPRLSLALDLAKVPTEQEMAVLEKFGITVPQGQTPPLNVMATSAKIQDQTQARMAEGHLKHGQNLDAKLMDAHLSQPPTGVNGMPPPMAPPEPMPGGPVQ